MTTSSIDNTVRNFIHAWQQAELRGDPEVLGDLLEPDFIGVGPRGFLRSKEEWLDRYNSGIVRNTAFELSEPVVREHGDTVIAIIAQTQRSTNNGNDASGAFRFTLIMKRDSGQIRLVGLHISPDASSEMATT